MTFDAFSVLKESVKEDDAVLSLSLFKIAMALAAPFHKGIHTDRYFVQVKKLAADVKARHESMIAAGTEETVRTRVAALSYILHETEQYSGFNGRYNHFQNPDMENADIIRVMDTRRGLPIMICLLYIHISRMNEWKMDGFHFPANFLCRAECNGERLIFDPFEGLEILEACDLRARLKNVRGAPAELSADFYKPCGNRAMLIHIQEYVKQRQIEAEDYEGALQSAEMMLLMEPNNPYHAVSAGIFSARAGRKDTAIRILENYIASASRAQELDDIKMLISQIRAES